MMLVPRSSIAGGGKGHRCRLQRSVVCDVQPPVSAKALSGAVGEVSVHHGEEIANLVRTGLVALEPTVPLPVWQAHLVLPLRTVEAHAAASSGSDGRRGFSSGTPPADKPWD